MPKLIPRTHADYSYNVRESAIVCRLTNESRILVALPAEHNFPLACPGLLGAFQWIPLVSLLAALVFAFAQANYVRATFTASRRPTHSHRWESE